MVRIGHVHDVLHERAAVARATIPIVGEEIAAFKRLGQIVTVDHRQAVTCSVNALKPQPPVGIRSAEWLAQSVHFFRTDSFRGVEVSLNHAVITA